MCTGAWKAASVGGLPWKPRVFPFELLACEQSVHARHLAPQRCTSSLRFPCVCSLKMLSKRRGVGELSGCDTKLLLVLWMTVLQITDIRRILWSVSMSAANFFCCCCFYCGWLRTLTGRRVVLILMMLLDAGLCVRQSLSVPDQGLQPLGDPD